MFLFVIAGTITTGIAIYTPATALSAVTAMDLNLAILSTGIVCIFYTMLGGMKAVVWTDVIQSAWMVSGLFAVTVYAGKQVEGGFEYIYERAVETGRADFFVSSWDPTVRGSLQSVIFGNVFGLNAYSFCVSQAFVQRYISCKSVGHARASAYASLPWLVLIITLCMTSGWAMFAYFEHCDPAAAGLLDTSDQLMPYLTTFMFQDMPGVSAVYVSGAFAGALSTVSSNLRSLKFRVCF